MKRAYNVLEHYALCKNPVCINKHTILVKKVYKDTAYIPFCRGCLKIVRKRLKELKDDSITLNDKEIRDIYFKNLLLI